MGGAVDALERDEIAVRRLLHRCELDVLEAGHGPTRQPQKERFIVALRKQIDGLKSACAERGNGLEDDARRSLKTRVGEYERKLGFICDVLTPLHATTPSRGDGAVQQATGHHATNVRGKLREVAVRIEARKRRDQKRKQELLALAPPPPSAAPPHAIAHDQHTPQPPQEPQPPPENHNQEGEDGDGDGDGDDDGDGDGDGELSPEDSLMQAREELGLRNRKSQNDNDDDDFGVQMQSEGRAHEAETQQLLAMAQTLKRQFQEAHKALQEDNAKLDQTDSVASRNLAQLDKENARLTTQLQETSRTSQWMCLVMLVVVGGFVFTLLVIKMFPKQQRG